MPKLAQLRRPWALEVRGLAADGTTIKQNISPRNGKLAMPKAPDSGGSKWVSTTASIEEDEVARFSLLRQTGREQEIVELLKEIDERVSGLELLSPSGQEAELFVRTEKGFPLLPVTMMGDGFQRCLEMGLAAAAHNWPTLLIDEFENGLHHSALEAVWRWAGGMSIRRDVQIFASTHSEECLHAACRAFTMLNDDGLRVIRLDRRDDLTTAAVYDRRLVQAAAEADVEIRG